MLKFGEFIAEGGYSVPVVSISKDKVDLSSEKTRNEINRNIAAELSRQWMNPYGGWMKVSRILEMYSIFLPKAIFDDEDEGEEIVALNQFGDRWGADLNGTISSPNNGDEMEYYLYYSYGISDSGFYETYAVIVDEEELNNMLEDDEDINILGPEGELDSRQ
jgi:hypothetical protein